MSIRLVVRLSVFVLVAVAALGQWGLSWATFAAVVASGLLISVGFLEIFVFPLAVGGSLIAFILWTDTSPGAFAACGVVGVLTLLVVLALCVKHGLEEGVDLIGHALGESDSMQKIFPKVGASPSRPEDVSVLAADHEYGDSRDSADWRRVEPVVRSKNGSSNRT